MVFKTKIIKILEIRGFLKLPVTKIKACTYPKTATNLTTT